MANTRAYRLAEEWIRNTKLPREHGQKFRERRLELGSRKDGTPAEHKFDAVSEDGTTVAAIKAHSGRTARGKFPSGKIKATYTDVLFLSLVRARSRLLVLTDPEFYRLFEDDSDGKLPPGIEVVHYPLPLEIQAEVNKAKVAASREMG